MDKTFCILIILFAGYRDNYMHGQLYTYYTIHAGKAVSMQGKQILSCISIAIHIMNHDSGS